MRYEVKTNFTEDLIEQELLLHDGRSPAQVITRTVVKLQDEGIRKALIELGWAPPQERGE